MSQRLKKVDSSAPQGTHDLERATLALQIGAAQRVDSGSKRKLNHHIKRVEKAERRYRIANARVDRFKTGALVKSLQAYEREESTRAEKRASAEIDSTTPQVSPLVVGFAEIVLLVAEFAFYFDIFGRNLQANAPLITRVFTAVLAILVPVVGIMSARFFAGSVQYLRSPREGGNSLRSAILFVVVSTILLGVACFSTLRLVEWRYRAEDASSFGAAEHPPGTIMAIVFVVFILVDALTRAFMFDPGERTNIGRRWKARSTRAIDWYLLLRESKALERWQTRWFVAKGVVEELKNDCDQELLSATVLILLNRGDQGRPASKVFGRSDAEKERIRNAATDAEKRLAARTSGAPDEQLEEKDAHIFLPHRRIRLAVARLEVLKPPDDPKQETRDPLEDLARDQPPATPPPHDMSIGTTEAGENGKVVGRKQPHALNDVIGEAKSPAPTG